MDHTWLTLVAGHTAYRPEEFDYRTDLPVMAAPAVRSLRIDQDTHVELRAAPGRHQVVLTQRDRQWVETVGPSDDAAAHLPVLRKLPRPVAFVANVEVGCTVTSHTSRGLRKSLQRLQESLHNAPLAVCVQDPEEPTAVTAVCCYPDPSEGSLMWRSWRALPESGCMVRTRAQLQFSAAPRPMAA